MADWGEGAQQSQKHVLAELGSPC